MKISCIIPAHNEEARIKESVFVIINTLKGMGYDYEIIIIDDCSEDDTYLRLIEQYGVNIYRKVVCQGKGAAIKTGWKLATGDYIVIIDADLQIKPSEIATFFRLMNLYDADVVVGNKQHTYSNVQYPFRRRIVSFGYRTLIGILFGLPLRDTQCGFKLFKKQALDLIMDKILVKRFAFDLEVLVALKENNIRVVDAPVLVTRPMEVGSVSLGNILETFKDTIAVWLRKTNGWYKCKS